jgi:hypothetical protein
MPCSAVTGVSELISQPFDTASDCRMFVSGMFQIQSSSKCMMCGVPWNDNALLSLCWAIIVGTVHLAGRGISFKIIVHVVLGRHYPAGMSFSDEHEFVQITITGVKIDRIAMDAQHNHDVPISTYLFSSGS